jgi:ArsR family transcriptional regulator
MDKPLTAMEGLFRAMADATRLRILALLLGGEVCVHHIHETLRLSQPKVSRHLAYLRRARLVQTRRQGIWIYYRLARAADPLAGTIRDVVMHTLGHAATIRRDADRLEKKTGTTIPLPKRSSKFACCQPD